MNIADRVEWLYRNVGKEVPIVEVNYLFNVIPIYRSSWWLNISDKGDCWFIMRTSNQGYHTRVICGNVYAIYINKQTGLRHQQWHSGVLESAVTLWPVRDSDKAKRIYRWITGLLDDAFIKASVKKGFDFTKESATMVIDKNDDRVPLRRAAESVRAQPTKYLSRWSDSTV
jgi:hypothetical protein